MTITNKIDKLKSFENEKAFREFLIDLLKKMGFQNVVHTHRYGFPELGKDIIAKMNHNIDGDEWYSFVVKHGRIGGGTSEIENIKDQISQSYEYAYLGLDGKEIKINKVKVVTNENFTNGAQHAISNSPKLKMFNNHSFWWNESLVEIIDAHFPDFWLPGDTFIKTYAKELKKAIKDEFELKDLSQRKIEDKNVKKLVDIFIDPDISEANIEENTDKEKGKRFKRSKVTIQTIVSSTDNFVIVGEAGSGKTKILNNIICDYLESPELIEDAHLPIKLKAKKICDLNFDLNKAVLESISTFTNGLLPESLDKYRFHLFIDEIELLNKEQRAELTTELDVYCSDKHRYILTKRRSYNIEVDEVEKNARTLRIHNFNINQVKNFIEKFFDLDKGKKFINILTESNILQKLPTTPLTITLLSLLYDGNSYEIPATLTDIYDDFSGILLGKLEVRSKTDLLLYNIKRRLFTIVALDMLTDRKTDLKYDEFEFKINSFLSSRGYAKQSKDELLSIIENSGILYIDENERVGFKQQAFIEYLSSIEIYDHRRSEFYDLMLSNFNDVSWQSTAIFFAGRSKDLPLMIDDLLSKIPDENLRDWFITTGGMGYLSQALYQTEAKDRKKLIFKALENLCSAFDHLKEESNRSESFFHDISLPLIATILNYWFIENFKSITLKQALSDAFNDLLVEAQANGTSEFYTDYKLFMIASALMNKNIGKEDEFTLLMGRNTFIKNPVLMIAGDMFLDSGDIHKVSSDKLKGKFEKVIKQYIKVVNYMVKEPAYRISEEYKLLPPVKLSDKE